MNEFGSTNELGPDVQKGYLIEKFRHLKEDYSDEMSSVILHGKCTHKVQHNWWTSLIGFIEYAADRAYLSGNIESKAQVFAEKYSNPNSEFKTRLTKKEDIEEANNMIDIIVEDLKSSQNEKT